MNANTILRSEMGEIDFMLILVLMNEVNCLVVDLSTMLCTISYTVPLTIYRAKQLIFNIM